jgi:Tfp pilus assembly protein PilF
MLLSTTTTYLTYSTNTLFLQIVMTPLYKYLLTFAFFLYATASFAQTKWPSPEVEQMYNQARDYLSQGNMQQAIVTYQQAIRIAPDQMVLYRDLGKAYFLSGNYKDAQSTLEPLLKSNEADDQSFQVMAACQVAAGEKRKAKSTIQNGLSQFPNSGLLYHELGKIYEEDGEMVYALQTWLDGIHKDPLYHVNYYEAARTYANTNKPVWVILYGETFVNMERHTPRSDDMRGMILEAYAKLFNSITSGDIPKFGKAKKTTDANNFEDAVRNIYLNLAPVVSDGITTENLTMLRTRFLMEWFAQYGNKYPLSLFTYQDNMLRNGYFEIYNEWLFGRADNAQEFEAWNQFHKGDISRYETWAQQHRLQPQPKDFYNDMQVDNIFLRKKKEKE